MCPEKYGHGGFSCLDERHVHIWPRFFSKSVVLGIARNADHFCEVGVLKKFKAFANGIFIRPDLLGRGFINDGHARAVFADSAIKILPAHQGNAHGLKIFRRYLRNLRHMAALAIVAVLPFAKERASKAAIK